MDYFYNDGLACYICRRFCASVATIQEEAQEFAQLIGVTWKDVYFGKIIESKWASGNYLFYAICPYPGPRFKIVKSFDNYIERAKVD